MIRGFVFHRSGTRVGLRSAYDFHTAAFSASVTFRGTWLSDSRVFVAIGILPEIAYLTIFQYLLISTTRPVSMASSIPKQVN
ncbi:MAG: hypothetical protein ACOYOU_13725, partial [Kiritimatiellia bacterium]